MRILYSISLPLSRHLHHCAYRCFDSSHSETSPLMSHAFTQFLQFDFKEKVLGLNSRAFCKVSNVDSQTEDEKVLVLNSRVSNVDAEREDGKMPVLNSRAFSRIWDGDKEDNEIYVEGGVGGNGERFESGVEEKMVVSNSAIFSRVSKGDAETDDEIDEGGGSNDGSLEYVDLKEVDRICKVIEDLFASDRNMEAVLDQCGIDLSRSLVLSVLARFCHARKPAFRFFCWAGQRPGFSHDSQTYNSMMRILGKAKQFETMVETLEEMGKKGLFTIETFSIAIRAFAAAREMKKSIGIFDLMKRHGFEASVNEFNHLLDALSKEKLGKEAQVLFDKMKNRFPPDLRTYSILLAGWCNVKNLIEASRVWNEMIDAGLKPDIVAHNTMLEGLFKGRRKSESIKLFEIMKAKGPSPNVRSYTILIRDLCKGNDMEQAVQYFNEMLESGCQPDAALYTCLIVGFGNVNKMDKVYGLLKEMREKGCSPDGRTYNAIIKLMTNRNMPDDAVRVYKKMIGDGLEPTIHTYNMMMKSYFHLKNYEMGCAVWDEMGKKGCCPDVNSYTVLIGGLIRQGSSEEACKYIEEMINKGMKAPQLDYNKLAADSSRAGKPDVLEELARKTKFSGKFEDSNVFARWGERMKTRVKRRNPDQTGQRLF